MTYLLVVPEPESSPELVRNLAESLADALATEVRSASIGDREPAEQMTGLLDELTLPDVEAVVLSGQSTLAPIWRLIQLSPKPVVVLPRRTTSIRPSISRVLLPLDGSAETSRAVGPMADRLMKAGRRVLAMHVFDQASVPAFWDQPAHAHEPWSQEFLLRHLPEGVSVEIRRGTVVSEVLAGAEALDADLIVLGWSRQLEGGRAPTVRRALIEGSVPVMLIATDVGPPFETPGRSTLVKSSGIEPS